MPRAARGFTLIEILVVILIISIVSAIALVTITQNSSKEVEQFSKKLVYLITLAQDEAMLQPATLGLGITTQHYTFYRYQENKQDDNPWHSIKNNHLKSQSIPSSITISLSIENKTSPQDGKPHLIISQNGDITPFTMILSKNHGEPLYQITGKTSGEINIEAIHD